MGFWIPALHLGFTAPIPPNAPVPDIFYFESLCVVSALVWAVNSNPIPSRIAIFTDSLNTVEIFHSLRAEGPYNTLLLFAVEILLRNRVSLRVFHIPGTENIVADALSRELFQVARNSHRGPKSRQPERVAWSCEKLLHERAIALGHAIEKSTAITYSSHLKSYLNFCKLHSFPIEPTPDTLSFFTVYMCHHIQPSVDSYLSGICQSLEPYFPDVRKARNDRMVVRSLAGCKKLYAGGVVRKKPLTEDHLRTLLVRLGKSTRHDDQLFLAIVFTGFHALMRSGELVVSDDTRKRSFRKLTLRHSVVTTVDNFSFRLPMHKADRFYEGSHIVIQKRQDDLDPVVLFARYLSSRDSLFPLHPELWLDSTGRSPGRSWFVRRLRQFFPVDIAGHSLRSGGATALALAGVPDDRIQAIGRWSSDAFKIYIRKHPVLLQALIHGQSIFQSRQ